MNQEPVKEGDAFAEHDLRIRREFERAVIERFLKRLKNARGSLPDELKMVDAFCEIRKQDIAKEKVEIDARDAKERLRSRRTGRRALGPESENPEGRGGSADETVELKRAIRKIYGVDMDG